MPDDTMAPWSEVAEQMRQAFPNLNPEEMERRYNHALSLGAARQQVQDREAPGVFETIQRNAAPFLSPVSNTGMEIAYGRARQRYEAGRPEPTDFETIARHEQEREARERQGFGGQVLENLSGLPAVAGEMALTGGATSGLRAPVRAALLPLTTPSFGLAQGTIENNIQQGRDPLSVRGLPGAYLRSLVQAAVFEGMGGAGNVLGAGVREGMRGAAQRFVQRTLGGTAAMEAGNDLADAVGQFGPAWLTGEDKPGEHRYGAIGAALRGEHGQALQQLALHGMTNAAFALMHAPRDNPAEQARVIEESRRATQERIDAEHVRRNQTAVPSLQEGPEGHAGWTTYPTIPDVERMTPEQRRAVAEHYGYGPVLDTFDRLNRDIAAGGVSILTTPPGRPAEAPRPSQTAPESPEAPDVHPVQAAADRLQASERALKEHEEAFRERLHAPRPRDAAEAASRDAELDEMRRKAEQLVQDRQTAHQGLLDAMQAARPAPEPKPEPVQAVLGAVQEAFPGARLTPRGEIEAHIGEGEHARTVYVRHDAERNVTRIDFEGTKPGVPLLMQRGSLDVARGLRTLLAGLHGIGSDIEYRAIDTNRLQGRTARADIYARALERAGFERAGESEGMVRWRPAGPGASFEQARRGMEQAGHPRGGPTQQALGDHFNRLLENHPESAASLARVLNEHPERAAEVLARLPQAMKEGVDNATQAVSGGQGAQASLRRGLGSRLRESLSLPEPQPAPQGARGGQGGGAGEGPAETPGAGQERGGRPAPADAVSPAAGNELTSAQEDHQNAQAEALTSHTPAEVAASVRDGTQAGIHDAEQAARDQAREQPQAGGQPEAGQLGMGAAGAGGLPPGSAPPGVKPIGSPLVPEPEPGRGRTGYLNWWQKALDAVKSFAGQTFPRLTRFSRPAGEALAAAANSDRSWKDRWNYISRVVRFGGSSIADMSPEQRRWLGGAVVETRARLEREALEREGKPTDHVGTLIGQADSPFQTEADYQQARDDLRELREALRQEWTPVVEKDFRDIKGMDEFEEIHQRNQIPGMPMSLIPLDETAPGAVRMGGKQGLQNLRVRNPSFTRRATLTGDAYDIDLAHMMQRRLQTGTQAAARAKAVRELLKSGTLEQLKPGQQPTEGFRELMLRPSGGLPGLDPNARYYAMSDVAGEIQRGLGIGERFGAAQGGLKALQSVMNIPTSIGLLSPAEITTHVANNIGALRTPELGRSFWQNVGGAIRDGWRAFRNDPETLRRIKDLSEIGASFGHEARGGLLSTVGLGRWSAYDPTTYVNRFTSSFIDVMQKGVRLQLDSMLDRMARARGIEFSDTERRDFINQSLGNYNNRASNTLTQFLKDSGIQPFATAAHTFTSRAVRTLFGGGVMPTAQTWTDAAQMRAISYAKMLPVLALGPAVNAMLWGDAFPKGVPTLAIKVSDEDHMDPLAFLGLRRGARITGVNAVVEGLMRGDRSASQIFDRAVRDFRMSMGHLLEGPPVQTLHTALTGENFAGHRLTDRKPASQTLANLGAAAGNVNPLVGTLTGADRPKNPPSLPQRLLRSIGPFGLRPTPKQ